MLWQGQKSLLFTFSRRRWIMVILCDSWQNLSDYFSLYFGLFFFFSFHVIFPFFPVAIGKEQLPPRASTADGGRNIQAGGGKVFSGDLFEFIGKKVSCMELIKFWSNVWTFWFCFILNLVYLWQIYLFRILFIFT